MRYLLYSFFALVLFVTACSTDEISENERTNAEFLDSLGGKISYMQWWRTAVTLKIDVTTNDPVTLMLLASQGNRRVLYDYKEVANSGIVTMTIPQGQGNTFYLRSVCNNKQTTQSIHLSGKPEEIVYLNTTSSGNASTRVDNPPASLCGFSINGDAQYYTFTSPQLSSFLSLMATHEERVDAKEIKEQICNYELESNGPFYITWVTGNESKQTSHILGYYYHSASTYDDIMYVDMSETHKWDYIDGLAKVQYQILRNDHVDGHTFYAGTWYDANFDMSDLYGATICYNMDRVGDDAYNMYGVYNRYGSNISALRGISFKIDVPEGMRIGFFLRCDEEPLSEQWSMLRGYGIRPYIANQEDYMGMNFSAEFMNIWGQGKGTHRSFIKDNDEVYWMGMEDILDGGDLDCNDVIFGVTSDLKIHMPTIVDPTLAPPEGTIDDFDSMPWTIAYEDVGRHADFDFNDAVIKLEPDYENELCCVTVMAAGSTSRMYLHYDGPDGDVNMGEIHDLLGNKNGPTYINTRDGIPITPFAQIDCVPWPKGYTMAEDAKRFYIEIQRGNCDDCTDVITLAQEAGKMPEAILVAGEWQWPKEGVHIKNAYGNFPGWAEDVTKTRFWDWYKFPEVDSYVSY